MGQLELAEIEAAVGSTSFKRGRTYARGNRVVTIEWDPEGDTLLGRVVGLGALYDTAAYFSPDDEGQLAFADGECTCPVGHNCKHVAAIVIAATDDRGVRRPAHSQSPRRLEAAPPAAPQPSPWETSLRALIEAPATQSTGHRMAIELTLQEDRSPGQITPRLMARLMRAGARGGWVNGALSWGGLDSWQVKEAGIRPDHLALVRELHAIHRAHEGRGGYYAYSYGGEKTLDLSACDSPQLWSLLDDAQRLGLAVVHAQPALGEVQRHRGELLIDVTRGDTGGSLVRAVIGVEGDHAAELEPLLFLGPSGHGLVCAQRTDVAAGQGAEQWRLHLVRLARPAAPQLRRMVLERQRLEIPATELQRFADELCPGLRHLATVVSSDGSFTPPEISPPSLVLRASYGSGHAVAVGWEWAYQVGETMQRAPLGAYNGSAGFRDPEAERAIVNGTVLADSGLARFGLLDVDGRPAGTTAVSLAGIDSMRLATEELPRLAQLPDVTVQVDGEPPDYRDVEDSLEIGVSTADIAGERDWFDLGVTISVEGRELPFAEVFVALANGQSRMLLDDGAHFSLLAPRLQSLRTLIEEARALTDSPSGPLRISRYQAGLWDELAALGIVTEQAQEWKRHVDALLSLETIGEHEPPAALAPLLRPYQREGFGWLATLWELGLGGILADDMGLGKTLQALAMICHARERDACVGPFLVVSPTSVVSNWVAEAAHFAPGLRVEAITDTLARSGRAIEAVASADLVVTTYTLLRLEAETYQRVSWAGLLLDEAQYVKNHQAKTYRAVRELAAPFKLAITGTPMENNLMELWSLLSITAPGLFPDPGRFAEQYARPIERAGDSAQLERLRRRIKPLVKRRS
ncbi:MAG: SNF2-related protein, partial [Solirubrobacteraceae bacterium]